MGRRALIVVAATACALLILLLGLDRTPPRAPPRPAPPESETARELPVPSQIQEDSPPTRGPTHLKGHVYWPDGSPVEKAEVRVVHPKTYELVRSGSDGAYELPFDTSGRFLIEAALTIQLAPERAWVDIPEDGEPAPLDFHLQLARGAIFGEVTLEGVPTEARLYLYASDAPAGKPDYEVGSRNGYFNFYLDPPKDVPLRLELASTEGILPAPVRFTWTGKPMDLGKIDLTPYPTLNLRMRLPDGAYAKGVVAVLRENLQTDLEYMSIEALCRGSPLESRMVVPEKQDVTTRRVFIAHSPPPSRDGAPAPSYMVEREVTLLFGRPREVELVVRPGPLVVTSRLVDREGRGLRGRLRCGESEVATGADGAFQLTLPHGGLHRVFLVALDVDGIGPVELARGVLAQSLLLDADNPAECVYDTGGRILLLASAPCAFRVRHTRGRQKEVWSAGAPNCFSPRLPGSYLWTWDDTRGSTRSGEIQVDEDAIAVVDLR